MDARAREKKRLFIELYQLDEGDHDGNDLSPLKYFTHHPSSNFLATTSSASIQRSPQPLARTVSAPSNPATSLPSSSIISILEDTPLSSPVHLLNIKMSTKKTSTTNKSFPVPKVSKKTAEIGTKRKRAESFKELPESQKFFTGLLFYFLPNNDVCPKRRTRIRIAMERGALWVKNWRNDITHIVVDDSLCYKDLVSFLKVPTVPPNIIIVNENYIPECMAYRDLVNPDQPQYHVKGQKEALKIDNGPKESRNTDEPATVSSSNRSLVLKPDQRFPARGPQTPFRTDGSEQESLRQHLLEAEARAQENQRQIDQQALNKRTSDALDDAIAEVITVKNLPMDLDDDETSDRDRLVDDPEESGSEDERKAKRSMQKFSCDQPWQQNFNCMHKHDGLDHGQNPNHRTIEILQQMADYYDRTRDQWRVIAYRRVIAALRKQKVKIITKEQALTIPFVGERLAEKIEEIVWTDKLRRLDNAVLDPNDEVLKKFLSIYGVGIAQASRWIDQGYRTLEDLRQKAELTKNQAIGLAHYEDFLARVPRKEVDSHGKVVRNWISKVDSGIQVIIGGSYRRGAADSGDIDFIITKPDTTLETLRTVIVDTVIPLLFNTKYLRAALAATTRESGSKWHGAASLPGSRIWRRVDFLLVPGDELGAALIYFTGNDLFNRSIRLLASKKGMRLNQRGLYKDVIRGKNRERITQGTLVEGKSEKRIFDILGVPYRPPDHRIC